MTELARTPAALQRLFQMIDLAPIPGNEIIAKGATAWKQSRGKPVYPNVGDVIAKQNKTVCDHAVLAAPIGKVRDFNLSSAGPEARAALGLAGREGRLSVAQERRLAARLRRLFELALEIGELVDVRFTEGRRRYEILAAPVCSGGSEISLFCLITHDDFPPR